MTGAGSSPRRQAAFRKGVWAEWVAAAIFSTRGYRIVARRWRCPAGEIDLIVRRGGMLVFVEVKARGDADALDEALTARQRRRIVRAAEAFLTSRPALRDLDVRFDAVLLAPWRWPRCVSAGWRAQE